jgi:hypothetical protein
VHPVGFTTEIYYVVRSYKRQIHFLSVLDYIKIYLAKSGISDIMIVSCTLMHGILYRMSNVGVCEDPVILKRVINGITIAKTLNL